MSKVCEYDKMCKSDRNRGLDLAQFEPVSNNSYVQMVVSLTNFFKISKK